VTDCYEVGVSVRSAAPTELATLITIGKAIAIRFAGALATTSRSPHGGEISPEVLEAVRAAEQRGEMGRIDENDVAGSMFVGRHPVEAVELPIAGLGEGMGRSRSIG
jgi:hypothetical protein